MCTNHTIKEIEGYEKLYSITSCGKVWSNPNRINKGKGAWRKTYAKRNGYIEVVLCKDSISKHFYLHRLVANAFLPKSISKAEINHLDLDKSNNQIDNLEWITHSDNLIHYFETRSTIA